MTGPVSASTGLGPVLGVETSCDETSLAIVHGGHVLSNVIATQIPMHARFGGVVPEIASRNHLLAVLPTMEEALARAGLDMRDLGGLAVTVRPGLMGALLVGVQTAKALALALDRPIVGLHHTEAHLWAVRLAPPGTPLDATSWPRPEPPFLALAVSGGHTSLYRVDGPARCTMLGQTLDDAAGEALDKFATLVGLPYPGGPHVDTASDGGDPHAFPFARGMLGRDGASFSFSGLKTAARVLVEQLRKDGRLSPTEPPSGNLLADLCASFEHAVVEQLVRVTLRAAGGACLSDLVLAGGVAANRRLRHTLAGEGERAGLRVWLTPFAYCTDNGAMIAGLGEDLLCAGVRHTAHDLDASPTARPSTRARTRAPGLRGEASPT